MAFTLENVVPWGRSFDEYVSMFSLSGADLEKRILGCGDGPAAFNAGLTRRGGCVLSVDPLYRFDASEIRSRIDETCDEVLAEAEKNRDAFIWKRFSTPEELGRSRLASMEEFLEDYQKGDGRYVSGELPALPFPAGRFGLALCSHFLFLYSGQLSLDFHVRSIRELSRVAMEVRIFPLLELQGRPSRHLEPVLKRLGTDTFQCDVLEVPYEFQKGGNRMLRVSVR